MEQIIRTIFSAEAFSISTTSSSISVGGLALLLPFLVPNPFTEGLTPAVVAALKAKNANVYKSKDQNLAVSAWFFLISLTFVWIFSLSKKADSIQFTVLNFDISLPEITALVIYFIGISHTEIKEIDND